jgi:hypothetical protein
MTAPPASLAVVVFAPVEYRSIRSAVKNLARQLLDVPIELLIAAPATAMATLTDRDRADLAAFAGWRIVAVPAGTSFDEARASAVRAARAPIVAFVEDHSYPQAGWAAALVAAFAADWSAVGPVMENGNPGTVTSWANFLLEYGPWTSAPGPGETCAHLPGHNSAYRREVLTACGEQLATLLQSESLLHWQLVERGHRLTLDPALRTRHLNFSRFGASCALRFHVGRQFASGRCADWTAIQRLAYVAAVPLIALVRVVRVLRLPIVGRQPRLAVRLLPTLTLFSMLAALGEGAGYMTRVAGGASAYLSDVECDRFRFFDEKDTVGT